jgi:hypothetical protein
MSIELDPPELGFKREFPGTWLPRPAQVTDWFPETYRPFQPRSMRDPSIAQLWPGAFGL